MGHQGPYPPPLEEIHNTNNNKITTMKTYTAFNMNTMSMIIKAIDSLPTDYALRNESVRSITMDEDGVMVRVQFGAMHMTLVNIPELSLTGWHIDGQDDIWIER